MTVDTVPTSVSSLETLHRWRMPFGMRRERPRGRWQATSKRTDTRTVDDCETPCPPCKPGLGPQTPLGASLAPCSKTLPKRITCWTTPLVLATCSECSQENNKCFCGTQVLSSATRWPHFGLHTLDSEVKCARSQVRPFHDYDEATNTSRNPRGNWEKDYYKTATSLPYEDITGQDEPPIDSPPVSRESTLTRPRTQR